MDLFQRIEGDMRSALKSGEAAKLSVLRMLVSAVRMLGMEKNAKEIADGDVLQILQKQVKQRKESIVQFEKGNRRDLADKEAAELKILESYMPKQLGEEELLNIIKEVIAEAGTSAKSDIGKIMKLLMPKVAGKADGKTVNQLLMRFLK